MPKFLPFAIWAAISLGLLAGSGVLFWRDHAFKKRSVEAEGKITSISSQRISGALRYSSHVQWTDRDGRAHDFTITSGSGSRAVGDVIAVRYDPSNPDDYRYGWPIAATILGIIGVAFTGILIRMIFWP